MLFNVPTHFPIVVISISSILTDIFGVQTIFTIFRGMLVLVVLFLLLLQSKPKKLQNLLTQTKFTVALIVLY